MTLEVEGPATQRSVLDAGIAMKSRPAIPQAARCILGQQATTTHGSAGRFWFGLRFFAFEEDLSDNPPDAPLSDAMASGKEPFIVIGAIAGG